MSGFSPRHEKVIERFRVHFDKQMLERIWRIEVRQAAACSAPSGAAP